MLQQSKLEWGSIYILYMWWVDYSHYIYIYEKKIIKRRRRRKIKLGQGFGVKAISELSRERERERERENTSFPHGPQLSWTLEACGLSLQVHITTTFDLK